MIPTRRSPESCVDSLHRSGCIGRRRADRDRHRQRRDRQLHRHGRGRVMRDDDERDRRANADSELRRRPEFQRRRVCACIAHGDGAADDDGRTPRRRANTAAAQPARRPQHHRASHSPISPRPPRRIEASAPRQSRISSGSVGEVRPSGRLSRTSSTSGARAFRFHPAGRRPHLPREVRRADQTQPAKSLLHALVGSLRFAGHTGLNRVRFACWLSPTKKLGPGSYTLVMTAITADVGSTSQRLTFTYCGTRRARQL